MTRIEEERIDEMRPVFTAPYPPHWNSDEGTDKANEYVSMSREELAMGNRSDFELANGVYMVGRDSLELMSYQTAAKERIRWLSAQLARADLELKELRAQGGGKGLAGRFLDMWKGEIEDFDKKYGKHIIGTEYEFGSCDTHREEIEEARIKTLREVVPVLSHAVSALETEAVEPVAIDVDALAQEIRRVDGNHDLGAARLAEALMPFLLRSAHPPHSSIPTVTGAMIDTAAHALETKLGLGQPWEEICEMADIALTAALSEESKP